MKTLKITIMMLFLSSHLIGKDNKKNATKPLINFSDSVINSHLGALKLDLASEIQDSRICYESGNLKELREWIAHTNHLKVTKYNPNGSLEAELEYNLNGELDGFQKFYNELGKLSMECIWLEGTLQYETISYCDHVLFSNYYSSER